MHSPLSKRNESEPGPARTEKRGLDDAVSFVEGNAEALPFPDRSYDAVAIAFGIRNVPRIDAALKEDHRVLRIGGRLLGPATPACRTTA